MPGVAVHFVLADRVLGRWRSAGSTLPAPFDVDDPASLNAFYHGAVGPDHGYFPGGHSVLSDLAHCVRPAGLARRLPALAYLNPVAPTPWLLETTRAAVEEHTESCLAHVREGAVALADLNLDTGRPVAEEPDHPGTLGALRGLEELAAACAPGGRCAVPRIPPGPLVPSLNLLTEA